jgi:hypothetical protein
VAAAITLDCEPFAVLLVDDDDNSPDVRSYYTDALDGLGVSYDIWDTDNSDHEPDATTLDAYSTVIWFTGHEHGGFAGPGTAGDTALASFLDGGKCLFISSQDYHYDRGLTTFMSTYLGVNSISSDVHQTTVTGSGSVFGGLGSYTLSYPFTNYSDRVSPDGTAELAFSGDQGNAAANKDSGVYRTTFWGFPFEALPGAANRLDAMNVILTWCDVDCSTPGVPTLVTPTDGDTVGDRTPTFEWHGVFGSDEYEIQIDDDVNFSSPERDETIASTAYTPASDLSDGTYHWRVRGHNTGGCDVYGKWSSPWSVTIVPPSPILLVDDDDNGPDVRSYYTDALDGLGVSYDIWDTDNSDHEPDATTLDAYSMVIWFTGDEYGGFAGPGAAGDTALASFLDGGRCLFISSQDYHYDRGLTTFMSTYLGVDSISSDVHQTTVTGSGSVFGGLGSYALSYPFTNYSDRVSPDGTAELAFSGDQGKAAVNKDSGVYRTTFWGFPFEALPGAANRLDTMNTVLNWCGLETTPYSSDLLLYPYLGETNATSMVISWGTDSAGASEVGYGLDPSYGNATASFQ